MISSLGEKRKIKPLRIGDISSAVPFHEGLEYNPPARGVWNIVHTGMLIPEAHQIFICAQGCLRGVVLTAAEMNDMDRMSWVSLREEDMWNGEMESRAAEGAAHIIEQLDKRPPCVLIFLSCMHMFEGCDFRIILDELSERFPGTDFVNCYMVPTMRKTMSPDAMMKISLYTPIKKLQEDDGLVGLIGCDRSTDKNSELFRLTELAGKRVWEISSCADYEDYLKLGSASMLISYLPAASAAGKKLAEKLGIRWLDLPLSYDEQEITSHMLYFSRELGLDEDTIRSFLEEKAEQARTSLKKALETIGDIPVAIDLTAVPRPFELALLLAENGFNIRRIYSDHIGMPDKKAFERLKELRPDIMLYPTVSPEMRFAVSAEKCEEYLCIGQRAAYFTQSPRFVNIIEGGGMYGFDGITRMAESIIDAFLTPKDMKYTISLKGLGCESCLALTMTRTARILSIYAADISGVCSALYEYGGMTVIHDASGCNSTYTTHDEPRWYDMDSMVYISGLTERDAVMGNDEKLIYDICTAAEELRPCFIALCASPMPAMTGVDLDAVARETEQRTGITAFAVGTNGMNSYIWGAERAFLKLTESFVQDPELKRKNGVSVNISGLTPLDLPLDYPDRLCRSLKEKGITVNSRMGMDTSLDEVRRLSQADVTLVVSSCGLMTAKYLYEKYHIPYVVGTPMNEKLTACIAEDIKIAAACGENIESTGSRRICGDGCIVIGESVLSTSYACMLSLEEGKAVRVIETVGDGDTSSLYAGDISCYDEDLLSKEIAGASVIYADPLYRPLCRGKEFIAVPHRAFSGRCYLI